MLDPSTGSGQAPAAGLTQVLSDGTNAYLYGPSTAPGSTQGGRLAQYQTAMQYFGVDGLGSVRQLYNTSGEIIGNSRYDPYGNLMSHYGEATSVFGYTGEQWDAGTELEYLRARYYSPYLNQWIQPDPIIPDYNIPQSLNRYTYVLNNPVKYIDPSGQVYVTFDDGPIPVNDNRILDILKSNQARATFFFVGQQIDPNDPNIVNTVWRVVSEGDRLGNHSFHHYVGGDGDPTFDQLCLPDAVKEVLDTDAAIKEALVKVKTEERYRYDSLPSATKMYVDGIIEKGTGLFRAPGGRISVDQDRALQCVSMGYETEYYPIPGICSYGITAPYNVVRWSVDPFDWDIGRAYQANPGAGADVIYSRVIGGWTSADSLPVLGWKKGDFLRWIQSSSYGSFGIDSNQDNLLLHSRHESTVLALDRILTWIKAQKYSFDVLEPSWSSSR